MCDRPGRRPAMDVSEGKAVSMHEFGEREKGNAAIPFDGSGGTPLRSVRCPGRLPLVCAPARVRGQRPLI